MAKIQLPTPPRRYDPEHETARNDAIVRAFASVRAYREHIEVNPPELLVLRSPDGTRWRIEVDNSGVLGATAI